MEKEKNIDLNARRSRIDSQDVELDYNNMDDISPDDDPILTATITFDVTVDPNGQVISTSEGQIISESFQNPIDGISLADHQQMITRSLDDQRPDAFLTDANVIYQRINEPNDGNDSDNDSVSTSTESLIERSKKYMNEEAGIIILKRDNQNGFKPKNFNINLDFDLKNQNSLINRNTQNEVPKNFNINLDFDLNNEKNTDFEPENSKILTARPVREPGVDIDLMITRNTTTLRSESFDEKIEEVFEEEYRIENDTPYLQYRSPNLTSTSKQETKNENESVKIKSGGTHPGDVSNQNAKYEFIERLVERATQRNTIIEQNEYYERQLPKANNFSLEDCIEKVLEQDSRETNDERKYPLLRSFETLDIEALTKGFESEEINEGKLVLYITEKQLLQLLNQRAIIIPNKQEILASNELREKKLSLIDETIGSKLGRESPLKEVEIIIDQDNYKIIHHSNESVRDDSYDENVERLVIMGQENESKSNKADFTSYGQVDESITSFHHSKFGDDKSNDSSFGNVSDKNPDSTESILPREIKVRELDADESLGSSFEKEKHKASQPQDGQDEYDNENSDNGTDKYTEFDKQFKDTNTQYSSKSRDEDRGDNESKPDSSTDEEKSESEYDSNGKKKCDKSKGQKKDKYDDGDSDNEYDGKKRKNSRKKKSKRGYPSDERDGDTDSRASFRDKYYDNDDDNDNENRDDDSSADRKRKARKNKQDDSDNDENCQRCPPLFDKNYKTKPLNLDQKNNVDEIPEDFLDALKKSFEEIREQLKEKADKRNKQQVSKKDANDSFGTFPPDYVEINKKHFKNTNNQKQKSSNCCQNEVGFDDTRYNSVDEEFIIKDFEFKTPCYLNGYGTSYVFPDESDGRLIHYKDFDLLLPSENFEVYPNHSNNKFNLPKAYEFLENGLDFTMYSDNDALNELDRFVNLLKSSLISYTRIDWNSVIRAYSLPEAQEKANIMKKFVNGLTSERKEASSNQNLNDALSKLDEFISRVVSKNNKEEQFSRDTDLSDLNEIEELIRNLKEILTNWKRVKLPEEIKHHVFNVDGNKIVIRTTRKYPSKIYPTSKNTANKNFLKNKIIYSYTDEYDTSAFDVSSSNYISCTDNRNNMMSGQESFDIFNAKYSLNYSLKSYDPVILDNLGKPSVDQVSKYVSLINTGVKNNSLVQIHPIIDPDSKVKVENINCHESKNNYEPIFIDSGKYPSNLEEISKNFGSLCVTDFPIYVQGFDLNYNKERAKPIALMKQENKSTETVTNCKQRQ